LFGVFLDFDEDTIGRNRLDVAHIRVSTARKALIDEVVKIRVMGAEFLLWVVEEGGGRRCQRKERVLDRDDVTSVGSREAELLDGEGGFLMKLTWKAVTLRILGV
jgi:hypothetical protein